MNTKEVEKRPCGSTGVEIPILGIGAWMFGGSESDYWGGHDEKDAADLVAYALDNGVNYFDVAESYNNGRTEEALGKILGARRKEAIIGTKVGPQFCDPKTLRDHCEASLKRLNTDYVDIYMIHWPVRDFPLEDAIATLVDLKNEGKIRVVGVSNYGVKDLTEALKHTQEIGINQLHYNLLSRAIEVEVVPLCLKNNIGIMTYMSLLQGILTGKYRTIDEIPPVRTRTRHFSPDRPNSRHGCAGAEQEVLSALNGIRAVAEELGVPMGHVALGWLAAKPGVSCVLAGARNAEQLQSNIDGVTLDLSAETIAKLDKVTAPLLEKLGPNPDYWQSGAEGRIR